MMHSRWKQQRQLRIERLHRLLNARAHFSRPSEEKRNENILFKERKITLVSLKFQSWDKLAYESFGGRRLNCAKKHTFTKNCRNISFSRETWSSWQKDLLRFESKKSVRCQIVLTTVTGVLTLPGARTRVAGQETKRTHWKWYKKVYYFLFKLRRVSIQRGSKGS